MIIPHLQRAQLSKQIPPDADEGCVEWPSQSVYSAYYWLALYSPKEEEECEEEEQPQQRQLRGVLRGEDAAEVDQARPQRGTPKKL